MKNEDVAFLEEWKEFVDKENECLVQKCVERMKKAATDEERGIIKALFIANLVIHDRLRREDVEELGMSEEILDRTIQVIEEAKEESI